MKRLNFLLGIGLALFFFGCAGTNSELKKPETLVSGLKELQKGTFWYQRGCYQRSLEHFFGAHELFTAADQLAGVAMCMNNIGNVYRAVGDSGSAVRFFEESVRLHADLKDDEGTLQALSNKAAALIDGGNLEEADAVLKTAEKFSQKRVKPFVPLLNNRGILLMKKQQYADAEAILTRILANIDPANYLESAMVNFALGSLMSATGRWQKAVEFFETALEADRSSEFHKGIADDLEEIGSAYFNQGKNEPAVNFFQRSIKINALLGNKAKVSRLMEQLVKASEMAGMDVSVTHQFVNRWLEGKILEPPCE